MGVVGTDSSSSDSDRCVGDDGGVTKASELARFSVSAGDCVSERKSKGMAGGGGTGVPGEASSNLDSYARVPSIGPFRQSSGASLPLSVDETALDVLLLRADRLPRACEPASAVSNSALVTVTYCADASADAAATSRLLARRLGRRHRSSRLMMRWPRSTTSSRLWASEQFSGTMI